MFLGVVGVISAYSCLREKERERERERERVILSTVTISLPFPPLITRRDFTFFASAEREKEYTLITQVIKH